ncbi:MAG: response regulator [Anaerolineae bacterium]|nr:response regulator [Anaerolineae bacterium]
MPGTLIADDTPLIRSAMRSILQHAAVGAEPIVEACDGEDAIHKARKCNPDIVLLDIKMPGMNGLEAAAVIRRELPDTRVVILTAYDEFCYVRKALKLGVDDYLLKPVRPEKLVDLFKSIRDEMRRKQQEALGAQLPPAPRRARHITQTHDKAAARSGRDGWTAPLQPVDSVRCAIAYIQEYYTSPDLSLTAVADAVSLSPSHLSALFKEETGVTYMQHVTMLRIKKAQELLATTDQSVESVAHSVGYPNATNFYRRFRSEAGMTPGSYREQQA